MNRMKLQHIGFAKFFQSVGIIILLASMLAISGSITDAGQMASTSPSVKSSGRGDPMEVAVPQSPESLYLPMVLRDFPWLSARGVEPSVPIAMGSVLSRTIDLGVGWVRLSARAQWSALQPNATDPIKWDLLTDFENELRSLRTAGIRPIIPVSQYPRWATINNPFPTSCGAIRSDKFDAFAQFMRALVARYKTPEFDVHNWELGNEPDIDPKLVPPDSVFGCWGNDADPYYGGRYYGEMLKVVAPAIKAEDPSARIWIGGLLLDNPTTKPALFLRGILESGAKSYFDVVPYHSYVPYLNTRIDHDNATGGAWDASVGRTVGKARFLRQTLSEYGAQKSLFLNETGMMCPDDSLSSFPWCNPPNTSFYQMQADHAVRTFVRAMSENVMGYIWYTINGPGWRYTGLLDEGNNPKPAYIAYQQLGVQLLNTAYRGVADYGSGIEAYVFGRGTTQVHVVWAKADQTLTIAVPLSKFVIAYSRDGNEITPTIVGSDAQLQVGFEPMYLVRLP